MKLTCRGTTDQLVDQDSGVGQCRELIQRGSKRHNLCAAQRHCRVAHAVIEPQHVIGIAQFVSREAGRGIEARRTIAFATQ